MHSLSSGYRRFCWPWWKHWFDPRTYWYWLKYKVQRANRGWADCDVWNLDNYLSEWLPAALQRLKETKQGVPNAMFSDEKQQSEEWDETAWDRASEKWDAVLDQMVEGFNAYNRAQNKDYEKELGLRPEGEIWKSPSPELSAYYNKISELEERDYKTFEKGAALFIKHFGSLWD